jgi:hypothetical protein
MIEYTLSKTIQDVGYGSMGDPPTKKGPITVIDSLFQKTPAVTLLQSATGKGDHFEVPASVLVAGSNTT